MSNMRITEVIVQWLEEREWEERPEVDEDELTSTTSFSHKVGDFSVKCFLEAKEKAGFFKMFMYFFDSKVPEQRLGEVLAFVNAVNCMINVGALHLIEEDRVIRYYASVDVEDAAFEPQHISNMLGAGLGTMRYHLPQYMAICFGGKTAEEALQIEPEE